MRAFCFGKSHFQGSIVCSRFVFCVLSAKHPHLHCAVKFGCLLQGHPPLAVHSSFCLFAMFFLAEEYPQLSAFLQFPHAMFTILFRHRENQKECKFIHSSAFLVKSNILDIDYTVTLVDEIQWVRAVFNSNVGINPSPVIKACNINFSNRCAV